MSEESRSHKLGPVRHLHKSEFELMKVLLAKAGDTRALEDRLSRLCVQVMADGGMGSLYLVNGSRNPEERRFGKCVAELEFNDVDGVVILASLNVDKDGDLYELDIWKTDFSPVLRLGFDTPPTSTR